MIAAISILPARLRRASVGLKLGNIAGECTAIVLIMPMLLLVAFWNGFPLIYYDTGAYILEGLGRHFLVERSPVYSLFLRFGGAGHSLWIIVAIQAVATAFVLVECVRCVAPRLGLISFLALCAGLIVASGLPWYVGEVEPDCFAAIVVLAVYLLAFHAESSGFLRAGILLVIGGFGAAAHASHLLLAVGLWVALAVYRAIEGFAKSSDEWPKPDLAKPAVLIAIAVSLMVSSNFYFTRQVFVSRAGPAFLFARLLQDGIVTRLLDDTCPRSDYRLCAYKDILPPTANAWLWAPYSPFFKLGGFSGTRAESERIIRESFERYPVLNASLVFIDAARQFTSFRTGDQVEPQQWALRSTFGQYLGPQIGDYLSARQQKGKIAFQPINLIHVPIGYFSLLAVAALLGFTVWCRDHRSAAFLTLIMLALMTNAVICGALSNPHDRYQSRLIWLALFAVVLTVAQPADLRYRVKNAGTLQT